MIISVALAIGFAASGKTAAKFERMLAACTLTPKAIEFIDNEKQRVLFRGVLAATKEPIVKNAFAIVYEDLGPVRIGGDLIFNKLSKAAAAATERAGETQLVQAVDGSDTLAALHVSRELFDRLDRDHSGSLDSGEIASSAQLLALIRKEGEDDATALDRFLSVADADGDGSISFVEWANAAATEPSLRLSNEALDAVLQSLKPSDADEEQSRPRGLFGRRAPDERFDAMLEQCLEWDAQLNNCGPMADECEIDEDEGRLLQVLRGSLRGANCPPVADALRMCYADYSPLRLGGDVIFKLLKRVVAVQLKKKAKKEAAV